VRLTGLTSWHLPSGMDSLGMVVDVPVMLVFVLFEEIGWRGYLGPLLAADGRRAPHLRTGLLHGIWHLPLVFLATDGYLTEGNRWIIVPIFLADFTCAGQLYGWLRQVSGSVYPAVLTHTFQHGPHRRGLQRHHHQPRRRRRAGPGGRHRDARRGRRGSPVGLDLAHQHPRSLPGGRPDRRALDLGVTHPHHAWRQ
jgi:hypothetical protein